MSLLYHVNMYLEFLILACTIYILAPVITRDRASAYARVIAEELPDAMQVADRFHLHQNLLEAIKKALNKEIPATITIPHAGEDSCKKNRS